MNSSQNHESERSSRHVSTLSYNTYASTFTTDSSIQESSWSSRFPTPPVSVPISPAFSIPSVGGNTSTVRNTLQVQGSTAPRLGGTGLRSNATSAHGSPAYPLRSHQPPASHVPSPHDWHDGASSITIDTILEDRLLSTSFITTLLEENASIRSAQRTSRNSEAFSGFSEISYPPVASAFRDIHVQFSPLRTRMLRQPGWALPSAFTPIIESLNRLSEDSVNQDYGVKAAGFFNELHLKGSSSVHVTHALPPSPSAENLLDGYSQVDVDPYKGTGILPSNPSSLGTTSDEYLPEGSQAAHGRQSIPSIRSLVPSWISRISSSRSIRRVMARRTVRPLPPVPILNHTCVVETDGREADEFESLNPVNRSVIVDYGGNHSHRRRSSRFTPDKEEPFDDFMTVGLEMNFVQPKRSPQLERLFGDQWPWCFDTPMVKWDLLVQHQKRTFVILFVFLMVVFAAVGTTLGIVIRRKGATPVCSAGLAGARCDLSRSFSW